MMGLIAYDPLAYSTEGFRPNENPQRDAVDATNSPELTNWFLDLAQIFH